MRKYLRDQTVIDPSKSDDFHAYHSVITSIPYINHYVIYPFDEPGLKQNLVFTNPVFQFTKPERLSKKKGIKKEAGVYYYVFDPEPLGAGAFGTVYPILGAWRLKNSHWIFKTKSNPLKGRLVKTNAYMKNNYPPHAIAENYRQEQAVGQFIEHMGLKYPVAQYQDNSVLLMRKQQGRTLEFIIKQLEENPNVLTVAEKLKITVNLLEALPTQIHNVTIPNKKGYLVHTDIKPGNIIIDEHLAVKFIDYGLARLNTAPFMLTGTPVFLDPLLVTGAKSSLDASTDLSSLAKVIAVLWGDVSYKKIMTVNDLVQRNNQLQFKGLLHEINGLTDNEKHEIYNTIIKMNQYSEAARLTRDGALGAFKSLLDARLNQVRPSPCAGKKPVVANPQGFFNEPMQKRLWKRHTELAKEDEFLISRITDELDLPKLKDTPFAQALINAMNAYYAPQKLKLAAIADFAYLYSEINRLNELLMELELLDDVSTLTPIVNKIKSCPENDLNVSINEIEVLKGELSKLKHQSITVPNRLHVASKRIYEDDLFFSCSSKRSALEEMPQLESWDDLDFAT